MLKQLCVSVVALSTMSFSQAGALPDCQLDSAYFIANVMERSRPSPDLSLSLVVSGTLRNGLAVAYAKDEAVLVVDLQVVRATPAVLPSVNVLLRSSWALSPNYRFAAEKPLFTPREITLRDGKVFRVLRLNDGSVLFISPEGRFCNKALNVQSAPNVWIAGTLTQEPDEVELTSRVIEEAGDSASLRIIFNGVSAGQMSFQEVWVHGATVTSSTARNFDQFAKTVKIGPFSFDVLEAGGGKVTLRYEIAERGPVSSAELAKLPLRRLR